MRITIIAAIAVVAATATQASENAIVEVALVALTSGRHASAIQLATDRLSNPTISSVDKAKLLVIRGEATFDISPFGALATSVDMSAAVAVLSDAIGKTGSPEQICAVSGGAFGYRGLAYVRLRRSREALQDLQNAVLCEPNSAFAQYALGEVYYGSEDFEEAIAAYDLAIKLKPDYKDSYARRGNNYENLHKTEKALADYNEVLRMDPNDAGAYNNRATVLSMMGRSDDALADTNKAIEIEPESFMAYLNRAELYYARDDFKKARSDWNTAKAIFEKGRPDMEKASGPKAVAWVDYGLGELKEKLDDAPGQ